MPEARNGDGVARLAGIASVSQQIKQDLQELLIIGVYAEPGRAIVSQANLGAIVLQSKEIDRFLGDFIQFYRLQIGRLGLHGSAVGKAQ